MVDFVIVYCITIVVSIIFSIIIIHYYCYSIILSSFPHHPPPSYSSSSFCCCCYCVVDDIIFFLLLIIFFFLALLSSSYQIIIPPPCLFHPSLGFALGITWKPCQFCRNHIICDASNQHSNETAYSWERWTAIGIQNHFPCFYLGRRRTSWYGCVPVVQPGYAYVWATVHGVLLCFNRHWHLLG